MKVILLLSLLVCFVGFAHTDAEKSRYVDGILMSAMYVASDDNWASEGRDPDPDNVLSTWEGFLGRPGDDSWTSNWSMEERRAAFDWYLGQLSTTNCLAFSSLERGKVLTAFARCKRLAYTNSVPLLRRAALNPNCAYRDLAIEIGVDLGDVGPSTTEFVETIITNVAGYTRDERVMACCCYVDKVLSMVPSDNHEVAARNTAVRNLYKNRFVGGVIGANALDALFVSQIGGYEYSSNRLENAKFVLASPECRSRTVKKYTAITNQLLSSGQPLRWINVGGNE